MIRFAATFPLQLFLAAAAAQAQPVLSPVFASHAVLQRNQPIRVAGAASPGETVTVRLGNTSARGRAGRDGWFSVPLSAMPAGGPYRLVVTAPSGRTEAEDILIGDVFLCSGQSNMEMSVIAAQDGGNQARASTDDQLRLFTVAKRTAPTAQTTFADPPRWVPASPDTVPSFSAACFYMAQELRKTASVPVGAIHSSWGGSRISAWMGDAGLRTTGQGKALDLLRLNARDPAAGGRAVGEVWEAWWRGATGDAAGREPWQPDASLAWRPVPRISLWEDWGEPSLAQYNGMVWFRNEVTLTAEQARQSATLEIGPVDDSDQTWVNGQPIGSGGNPSTPRAYPLPVGTLVAGRNVVTVNANDVYAKGGMSGPAEVMRIAFANGSAVPLGAGWRYAIEMRRPGNPPRAPWDDTAGAGTIGNAMIAPLGSIGLRGVAWYQGESDIGILGYADRLAGLMADWRRQFGLPQLPFAIVQLANHQTPATRPGPSGWAELREQQRLAATLDGHAALAIAIDLGDPLDIHPGEKHEVGRRLARAMQALAYQATPSSSGPTIRTATRTSDGGVALAFVGVGGTLVTRSSDRAIGFELCGDDEASCRYATGTVTDATVKLPGDGQPVTRVRYAWADSPVVNLYDMDLPVGPFETRLR